ncbi:hypothetical protein [Paenibacillus spongiae]|uniref:Sporulation histidine kinase inhibitor Sda n=1 Tax=Paenibacillus spongiae TaxID=2909671 RepID=A0ABY5S6J6_9BACL|nr:hypothetical protein [Paenibacillus spongiae]UVI29108.1 hypothetical protein L1F29_27310 [Paenibacillus spongiae]
MKALDLEIQHLVDSLHLTNEEILEKFNFVFDQRQLTHDEGKQFLDFLRRELSQKSP